MKTTIPGATIQADNAATLYAMAMDKMSGYSLLDIEGLRTWALAEMDRRKGALRAAYLPEVHGQAATYEGKARQARLLQQKLAESAAFMPTAAEFPALCGQEAALRGLKPAEMAALVVAKDREWQAASDRIEAAALTAKAQIETAKTPEELAAALAGLPEKP